MSKKNKTVPKLHQFKTAGGEWITMSFLVPATGLSENAIRERLKCYATPPTVVRDFLMLVEKYPTLSEFRDVVSDLHID